MRAVFPPTPLQHNALLSERYGAEIWLKREDLSPVRSYKIRGALNAMRKRLAAGVGADPLFVCASAGNHAQGLAYMCRHFGVRGAIFMPVTTPQQKITKTRMFGGESVSLHLVGDYFDDTLAAAQEFCRNEGGCFLSPFDDPDVIEGQASVAVEIASQMKAAPDHIVLPVGGGGLAAGIVGYFGARCGFSFAEPEGAASLRAALQTGAPVTLSEISNFVDGAAVARIGAHPFEALRWVPLSSVYQVPENRLCITITDMLNTEGIVLEPAGALSVDLLQDLRSEIAGKRVVCVTSGGNFDFERLPEVKERAQRYAGLKKYFLLRMPQRPGALKDFLLLLGPNDNITRFEYLKKHARNFGTVLLGIETTDARNFATLFATLEAAGVAYSDITNDETVSEFIV